jgi:ribosomal protein S18 acetylase RimI-like enzyme
MHSLTNIEMKLAAARDANEIATMSRDLVERGLGWSWVPERVLRAIRHPDVIVLTACAREHMLGFAIMHYFVDEAHLNLLAVYPSYRRAGVGRHIVEWLEASARVAGVFSVNLEVRMSRNDARAFYQRLGYRDTGIMPGYYRGIETAVRMNHDLRIR